MTTPTTANLEYLLNFKANECILAQKQFTTEAINVVFSNSYTLATMKTNLHALQTTYNNSTQLSKCILMTLLKKLWDLEAAMPNETSAPMEKLQAAIEESDAVAATVGENRSYAPIDFSIERPMYQIALIHAYSYNIKLANIYIAKMMKTEVEKLSNILSYILIPDIIKSAYDAAPTDPIPYNINKNFKSGMMFRNVETQANTFDTPTTEIIRAMVGEVNDVDFKAIKDERSGNESSDDESLGNESSDDESSDDDLPSHIATSSGGGPLHVRIHDYFKIKNINIDDDRVNALATKYASNDILLFARLDHEFGSTVGGGSRSIITLRNIPKGVLGKLEGESLEKMLRLVNTKLSSSLINKTAPSVADIIPADEDTTMKLHWFRDVAVRNTPDEESEDANADTRSYLSNLQGALIKNMPARCDANSVFSLRAGGIQASRGTNNRNLIWVSSESINGLPKIEFRTGYAADLGKVQDLTRIYSNPLYQVWAKLFTITGTDSTLSSIRTDDVQSFIHFFKLNTLMSDAAVETRAIKALLAEANVLRHPIFPYSAIEPVWYSNTWGTTWASPPGAASGNLWISSGKKIKRANIKTLNAPVFNEVMSSLNSFYYSIEDRWHDFHGTRGLFYALLTWFNGGEHANGMQAEGGNYIFPVDVEDMAPTTSQKSQFFTAKRGTSKEKTEYKWGPTIQPRNVKYNTFIPFNINCTHNPNHTDWECALTFNWKQWTSSEEVWRSSSIGTPESYFSINSLSNLCFHWINSLDNNEWFDINCTAQGQTYFIKGLSHIREAVNIWMASRQEPDPPIRLSNQLSELYASVKSDLGAAEAFKWILYVIFALKKMGDASSSTFAYIYNCVVGALKILKPRGLHIQIQDAPTTEPSEFQLINHLLLEQGDLLAAAYGLGCGFQVYGMSSRSLYGIVRNSAFINPDEKKRIRAQFNTDQFDALNGESEFTGLTVAAAQLPEVEQDALAHLIRDYLRIKARITAFESSDVPELKASSFKRVSGDNKLDMYYSLWRSYINENDALFKLSADVYNNILDIMETIETLKESLNRSAPPAMGLYISTLQGEINAQQVIIQAKYDTIVAFKIELNNRKFTFSTYLRIPDTYTHAWRTLPTTWAIDPATCSSVHPETNKKAYMRDQLYNDLCGKNAPSVGVIDNNLDSYLQELDLYELVGKRPHGGINKTLLTKGGASYNELTQHMPDLNFHDTNPNDDGIPDSRWERYRYYGKQNINRWNNQTDMGTLFKLLWLSEPNFSYKQTLPYPTSWFKTEVEHTKLIEAGEMPDTPTDGTGTDLLLKHDPVVSYIDAVNTEKEARAAIPAVQFQKNVDLPGIKIFLMLNPENINPSGSYRTKHESRLMTRPQYARLDMLFAYAVMDYSNAQSNNITSLNEICSALKSTNGLFGFLDTAYQTAGLEVWLRERRALLPDWADLAAFQAAKFSEHGVDRNIIIDINSWGDSIVDKIFPVNIAEHEIKNQTLKTKIKQDLKTLKNLLISYQIGDLRKTNKNSKYHDDNWGYNGMPALNKFTSKLSITEPSPLYTHFYAPLLHTSGSAPTPNEILHLCAEREGIIVDFFSTEAAAE